MFNDKVIIDKDFIWDEEEIGEEIEMELPYYH